jgi:hypothetical protein
VRDAVGGHREVVILGVDAGPAEGDVVELGGQVQHGQVERDGRVALGGLDHVVAAGVAGLEVAGEQGPGVGEVVEDPHEPVVAPDAQGAELVQPAAGGIRGMAPSSGCFAVGEVSAGDRAAADAG